MRRSPSSRPPLPPCLSLSACARLKGLDAASIFLSCVRAVEGTAVPKPFAGKHTGQDMAQAKKQSRGTPSLASLSSRLPRVRHQDCPSFVPPSLSSSFSHSLALPI